MKLFTWILLSMLATSCISQESKVSMREYLSNAKAANQIAEYVVSVFIDSKENLWFGTLQKGIARYDGEKLNYFTEKDGLPSNRVTGIIEDSEGVYWLTTGEGLSKYDGNNFTNFSVGDDFSSNMITNLLIDSNDEFWVGTWNGVYKFDGESFYPFPIPYPEVETKINEDTKYWITEINEDSEGNIWFARDGFGVCKYDGKSFIHLLRKDGLHSNYVTEIEFDRQGAAWIGTRVAEKDNSNLNERFGKGGINRLVEKTISSFSEIKGFNDGDVYMIHRDKKDNIWIGTTGNGVYKYDGIKFDNYEVPISIMGMMEDKDGNYWLAGAGGLYKINRKGTVINVTTEGPW